MIRYYVMGHTPCKAIFLAPYGRQYCPQCGEQVNIRRVYAPAVMERATIKTIRVGDRVMTPEGHGIVNAIVNSGGRMPDVWVDGAYWPWEQVQPIEL